MAVLTELRTRGITDVFFVVCDLADKWEQRYPGASTWSPSPWTQGHQADTMGHALKARIDAFVITFGARLPAAQDR